MQPEQDPALLFNERFAFLGLMGEFWEGFAFQPPLWLKVRAGQLSSGRFLGPTSFSSRVWGRVCPAGWELCAPLAKGAWAHPPPPISTTPRAG